MKTIHKYNFPVTDRFQIPMPRGAVVLTAFKQGATGRSPAVVETYGRAQMWAKVDTDNEFVTKHFGIVGTGGPMPTDNEIVRYIATFQDGPFIWHLYELCKETI